MCWGPIRMDKDARDIASRAARVEAAGAGQHVNLGARDEVAAVHGGHDDIRPNEGSAAELGEKSLNWLFMRRPA